MTFVHENVHNSEISKKNHYYNPLFLGFKDSLRRILFNLAP